MTTTPRKPATVRSFNLTVGQCEHLRWYAEASGRTESDVVRAAIDALPWVTTRSLDPSLPPSHWPMTGT